MSLKIVLLGFLNKKKQTGYDLSKKIDKSAGFFWSAGQSQIYPTLKKLKNDGLVDMEQIWEDKTAPKIFYSLTSKGKEELRTYLHKLPQVLDLKSELCIHLFFAKDFISNEMLIEKLQDQKRFHQKRLDEYYQYEKNYLDNQIHKSNIGRYLTLEYGISYEKGLVEFCDWAEEYIKNPDANLQYFEE